MTLCGYMIAGCEEVEAPLDNLYCGPARYDAWPLDSSDLAIDKWLNQKQIELWAASQMSNIMLVDDWNFVKMYIQRCHQIGMPTRLYWLSTDESRASFINVPRGTTVTVQFCGWDYLGGCDQSFLFDDGETIFREEESILRGVHDRMTDHGLFASFEDALLYASVRNVSPLKQGLEVVNDAHILAVHQLILNDPFWDDGNPS